MNQPKYKLLDWVSAQSDKLDWYYLSENPAIFELDYSAMYSLFTPLREEIQAAALHPNRIMRIRELSGDTDLYSVI